MYRQACVYTHICMCHDLSIKGIGHIIPSVCPMYINLCMCIYILIYTRYSLNVSSSTVNLKTPGPTPHIYTHGKVRDAYTLYIHVQTHKQTNSDIYICMYVCMYVCAHIYIDSYRYMHVYLFSFICSYLYRLRFFMCVIRKQSMGNRFGILPA